MDPLGHQAASSGNTRSFPKLNELYRVAASGDCKEFEKIMEKYSALCTTSDKNSILHIATKFKWMTEVVGMIIHSKPSLVYEKNSKGETPLHIAARLGYLEIAKTLVDSSSPTSGEFEVDEKPTRAVNLDKDTPLHVAARHGHFKIVKLLIEQDSEWPKLTNLVNNAGDSPLFLAVDRGFFNIASFILKKTENCPCPYKGRDNINVLQTAVIRTHKVNKIPAYFPHGYDWRWLLHFLRYVNRLITGENCSELTSLEADVINTLMKRYPSAVTEIDDFGWTPLHHAAHLGHDQTVRLFLKDHSSLAYLQDKKGMSILHLVAKEGRLRVMKTLSNDYPDIWKLLDKEGRTALHVAAQSGKDNAVSYILKTPNLECLINEQDNQGNLASHLAAMKSHFVVAAALVTDKRVDKGAVNGDGLTAIDIIQSNTKLKYHDKMWLTRFLEESGGLHGLRHVGHEENTGDQNIEKKDPGGQPQRPEPVKENHDGKPYSIRTYTREHLRDIAQTSLLEATIIATVTFQAAFQLPGGTAEIENFIIRPNLLQNPRFKAFVISDAVAFVCSTFSMSIHFWASVRRNQRKTDHIINLANIFTYFSILAMVVAFIQGTSAMLPEGEHLFSATFYIGFSFFFLHSYFLFRNTSHKSFLYKLSYSN